MKTVKLTCTKFLTSQVASAPPSCKKRGRRLALESSEEGEEGQGVQEVCWCGCVCLNLACYWLSVPIHDLESTLDFCGQTHQAPAKQLRGPNGQKVGPTTPADALVAHKKKGPEKQGGADDGSSEEEPPLSTRQYGPSAHR